jgi:hypothetical protein
MQPEFFMALQRKGGFVSVKKNPSKAYGQSNAFQVLFLQPPSNNLEAFLNS